MTDKKEDKATTKHTKYNQKRQSLFRIEIVPSDDEVLMKKMKEDMIAKSRDPKAALIQMYQFALDNGYFDKD